ncbi:MAG: hypothetical protein K6G62_07155, partial [Eubacterium sp.]|nr:hypothetical protein [Eubacterium sp.]
GQLRGFLLTGDDFSKEFPMKDYEEFRRRAEDKYVHPEERERYNRIFKLDYMIKTLSGGRSEVVTFFRMRKLGQPYRYKCIRYSFYPENKKYIMITSQDVQEAREVQLMQEDANRKILGAALREEKETLEMRRNFSIMLSRELIEPLKAMSKVTLLEGSDGESVLCRSAVRYMLNVVGNVMEFERLEQGHVKLDQKNFALDQALLKTFQKWDDRVFPEDISYSYRVDLRWKNYYGDEARLVRLIDHIIGNCVLSLDGSGTINIWGRDVELNSGVNRLVLFFQDDGISVNEDFFGRNYALEMDANLSAWKQDKEYVENSFSLVVARKIAELMGGDIRLHSMDDDLNGIEVMIPLRKNENSQIDRVEFRKKEDDKPDMSDYSLLVIKRSPMDRTKTLGPNLKLCGADVDIAYSGKEGLKLWLSYPEGAFNAIVLEDNPTDMDFLEFTDMIRSQVRKTATSIPIIVLKDDVSQDMTLEGMRFGVNAILPEASGLTRLKLVLDTITRA